MLTKNDCYLDSKLKDRLNTLYHESSEYKYFVEQLWAKVFEKNRKSAKSLDFFYRIKCLIFNRKLKEAWKRVWSRSLGSRPLRTSGFNEFEERPKILRSKINL